VGNINVVSINWDGRFNDFSMSGGGVVNMSVDLGSGVVTGVLSGAVSRGGVVVLSLNSLEGSSTSVEGSSDSSL
jgi:hypothetical protein